MKKFIIAIAALFVAASASAQIGISAGLTSSSTTLDGAYADVVSGAVNQYHVGLTYKIGLGNLLAIQPSILYNVKGSNFNIEDITSTSLNFKTGFVEVPVQVQLGFGLGTLARVYALAEPYVGYAITNEVTTKSAIAAAANTQQTWDNVKNRF